MPISGCGQILLTANLIESIKKFSPVLLVVIIVVVVWELIVAINRYFSSKKAIEQTLANLGFLEKALASEDEEKFSSLPEQYRNDPAAAYLASCAEKGQQVNVDNFMQLLNLGPSQALYETIATANLLPIMGLMGTFGGIIIGILSIELDSDNTAEAIKPLISSAGLAFISSLVALVCASVLKYCYGLWKKDTDYAIEEVHRNLLVDYMPRGLGSTTDEVFSRSVRSLERSVSGFTTNFETVSTAFIAEFKPLVSEQRESNEKTAKHIDSIAAMLGENAKTLIAVSNRQKEQVESMTESAKKLSEASNSLQESMKIASENLKEFNNLGEEMQKKIADLHAPLKTIIDGQATEIEKLISLYTDLGTYNTNLQQYIDSFNAKMTSFSEVGEKVHEVRTDFVNFQTEMDKKVKAITELAMTIEQHIQTSFGEYDRNLRTLFTDLIEGNRDVHMAYYDPDLMKQVDKLSHDNRQMLESMQRYLDTIDRSTASLVGTIKSLRGWGIYRVKKDKKIKESRK